MAALPLGRLVQIWTLPSPPAAKGGGEKRRQNFPAFLDPCWPLFPLSLLSQSQRRESTKMQARAEGDLILPSPLSFPRNGEKKKASPSFFSLPPSIPVAWHKFGQEIFEGQGDKNFSFINSFCNIKYMYYRQNLLLFLWLNPFPLCAKAGWEYGTLLSFLLPFFSLYGCLFPLNPCMQRAPLSSRRRDVSDFISRPLPFYLRNAGLRTVMRVILVVVGDVGGAVCHSILPRNST